MNKLLLIIGLVFLVLLVGTTAYAILLNQNIREVDAMMGEWVIDRVLVDGELAPNSEMESGVRYINYWNDQYVILTPGIIQGFDGCNHFSGSYETGFGGRFNLEFVEATLEGCPEAYYQDSDDKWILSAKYDSDKFVKGLLSSDRIFFDGDELHLKDLDSPKTELIFTLR